MLEFAATPEFVVSVVLSTMGMSIMKSGLTLAEACADIPLLLVFVPGVVHDLTLDETAQVSILFLWDVWMSVFGTSQVSRTALLAAFSAMLLYGIYGKLHYTTADFRSIISPS